MKANNQTCLANFLESRQSVRNPLTFVRTECRATNKLLVSWRSWSGDIMTGNVTFLKDDWTENPRAIWHPIAAKANVNQAIVQDFRTTAAAAEKWWARW